MPDVSEANKALETLEQWPPVVLGHLLGFFLGWIVR